MRFFVLTLAFCNLGLTSNACAQQQVNLDVAGIIQTHCAFDETRGRAEIGASSLSFLVNGDGPVDAARVQKLGLGLTCNAPFTLAITSHQGGLTHTNTDLKAISGGFTKQIAYRATVSMTTEDAGAPMQLACESHQMAGQSPACSVSSGSNAAIGQGAGAGEVAIALVEGGKIPIQGRYQDTIFLALTLQ